MTVTPRDTTQNADETITAGEFCSLVGELEQSGTLDGSYRMLRSLMDLRGIAFGRVKREVAEAAVVETPPEAEDDEPEAQEEATTLHQRSGVEEVGSLSEAKLELQNRMQIEHEAMDKDRSFLSMHEDRLREEYPQLSDAEFEELEATRTQFYRDVIEK